MAEKKHEPQRATEEDDGRTAHGKKRDEQARQAAAKYSAGVKRAQHETKRRADGSGENDEARITKDDSSSNE